MARPENLYEALNELMVLRDRREMLRQQLDELDTECEEMEELAISGMVNIEKSIVSTYQGIFQLFKQPDCKMAVVIHRSTDVEELKAVTFVKFNAVKETSNGSGQETRNLRGAQGQGTS